MSLQTEPIAEQNGEGLLSAAYRPDPVDPGFRQETEDKLLALGRELAAKRPAAQQAALAASSLPANAAPSPRAPRPSSPDPSLTRLRVRLGWAMGLAAALSCVYLSHRAHHPPGPSRTSETLPSADDLSSTQFTVSKETMFFGLTPKTRPAAKPVTPVKAGETLTTNAGQRRRAVLEDGSVVYLNENTQVQNRGSRKI